MSLGVDTCSICLGTLASGSIGACVPCGHCYHSKCFDGWKEALNCQTKCIKCPTCNTSSNSFCRLYLDLGDQFSTNLQLEHREKDKEIDKLHLLIERLLEDQAKLIEQSRKERKNSDNLRFRLEVLEDCNRRDDQKAEKERIKHLRLVFEGSILRHEVKELNRIIREKDAEILKLGNLFGTGEGIVRNKPWHSYLKSFGKNKKPINRQRNRCCETSVKFE